MTEEKKRILVVSPAKHGIPHYFVEPLMSLAQFSHPKFEFDFAIESGNNAINISRNILVSHALKSPKNYYGVVQIDSDALWSMKNIVQLVDHEEEIIAAPYCRKRGGRVSWLIVKTPGSEVREDGMLQCDFLGTHCLYTKTSALRKMMEMLPETLFEYDENDGENKPQVMSELFPIGLCGPNSFRGRIQRIKEVMERANSGETGKHDALFEIEKILTTIHPQKSRLLGEDYHFTFLARKCGFKCWADLKAGPVGHVGDAVYPIEQHTISIASEFPSHTLDLDEW